MRLNLTLKEFGNVCLLLYFGTIGYIPILMPNTGGALTVHGQSEQLHGINHVVLLAVWGGIFWFLLQSHFRLRLDLLSAKVALAYVAVGIGGVLHSADRVGALTGSGEAVIATIYAIYLVSKFSTERLAVMLSWVIMLLAIGSALLAKAMPGYAIDHFGNTGAWQGVFNQKNSLGLVMALGIAIVLALKPRNLDRKSVV